MPGSACSSSYPPILKLLFLAFNIVQGKWDLNRQFLHGTLARACSSQDCKNQQDAALPDQTAVLCPQAPNAYFQVFYYGMVAPAHNAVVPWCSSTSGLQHAAFGGSARPIRSLMSQFSAAEAPFSKLSTGLTATGHWWAWYEPCQLREWEYMRSGGYRPPSCPAAEEIASFFTAGRDPIF